MQPSPQSNLEHFHQFKNKPCTNLQVVTCNYFTVTVFQHRLLKGLSFHVEWTWPLSKISWQYKQNMILFLNSCEQSVPFHWISVSQWLYYDYTVESFEIMWVFQLCSSQNCFDYSESFKFPWEVKICLSIPPRKQAGIYMNYGKSAVQFGDDCPLRNIQSTLWLLT